MRYRILGLAIGILVILTACGGGKADKFYGKFGDKLCDAYAQCKPDVACSTGSTEPFDDCEFDKDAAADCLDGEFVCSDEFGDGFEYIRIPDVCDLVYTDCDVSDL